METLLAAGLGDQARPLARELAEMMRAASPERPIVDLIAERAKRGA